MGKLKTLIKKPLPPITPSEFKATTKSLTGGDKKKKKPVTKPQKAAEKPIEVTAKKGRRASMLAGISAGELGSVSRPGATSGTDTLGG